MNTATRTVLCLAVLGTALAGITAQETPSLTRSGDVVYVALTDAKGAKLGADLSFGTDVDLWRKCGKFVSLTPAWLDWENSRVVCGGYNDRGLEPGEYTLACRAGEYGVFDLAFTLEKGKPPALSHKFETWRRVVTLRFVDEAGKSHPALPREPSYVCPTRADKMPSVSGEVLFLMLRDRPSRGGRGGFEHRRARGGGDAKYVTDAGKWHFVVVAGCEGSISGPVVLKSAFDGPEFEKPYEVKLDVDAGWRERTANLEPRNAGDPGRRSLVAKRGLVTRIKFELSNDLLVPELSDGHRAARTSSGWEAVIPRGAKVQYRLSGGSLFLTDWQPVPAADINGEVKLRPVVAAPRLEIEMAHTTLAAWWDGCCITDEDADKLEPVPTMRPDGRVYATLVDETRQKRLQRNKSMRMFVAGAADGPVRNIIELSWPPGAAWLDTRAHETRVLLSDEQVAQLARKQTVRVTAHPGLLAFRAVTADGAGVPRAQASIFPLEDEKVALRLKDIEIALQAKGKRPTEEQLDRAMREYMSTGVPADITDQQLKDWLGEELYNTLGDRDLRMRYARFGAWYDSGYKVATESHGFAVIRADALQKDTKYVLYLWGGSRDDLKPDLRVEFTGKVGGIDLGALVVPGHS